MTLESVDRLMGEGLDRRIFTAAVIRVDREGRTIFDRAYGTLGGPGTAEVTEATLFDLASVTKVTATTPCWMILAAADPPILDRGLSTWFADCTPDKIPITPRHLLAHASGLPAWRPYYLTRFIEDPVEVARTKILAEPLQYETGRGCLYSDLGFMLLAFIVRMESGLSLRDFSRERVFEPLGLERDLLFLPTGHENRIALTRPGESPGLVNDLNARSLAGVSGHAGLFGTARGVGALAGAILESLKTTHGRFDRDCAVQFCTRVDYVPDCTRALGFDTPSPTGSSGGSRLSRDSLGHTGFTGTSVWIDPQRDLTIVLLTNRVFMGEADQRIKIFRPQVHDTIMEALDFL